MNITTSFLSLLVGALAAAEPVAVTVRADQGRAISPDLFGIFFEDLSWSADGGLYAELVQNRSFAYSPADDPRGHQKRQWHALSAWTLEQRGGGTGAVDVVTDQPLNANNLHHARLTITAAGEGVGLANAGFDGIPLRKDAIYDLSVFLRRVAGGPVPFIVRLETPAGGVLASAQLAAPGDAWAKVTATLTATADCAAARLVLLAVAPGTVAIDMVSLFPRATFKGRPNGLRPDLAQAIADLKPKFVRFPGGCVAHGDGVDNIYRWKRSIGPVEERQGMPNIWRYHQTLGLGYYEYFQFCEDIGATPLPVLAAGVSCQNSHYKRGTGQECIPMADMPAYVQEVLDLIEWANGPATSTWGAQRAAAGHTAPFRLRYLGIGNEDHITPAFRERFAMINAAVKAKYPDIQVIGTVGPAPDGRDFDEGWRIARELHVDLVDEHYYKPPQWFLDHLTRYDNHPRGQTRVYVGEYAAHDEKRRTTLRSALAEAAFLTSLERNGDVVALASYAPLMAKYGHVSWAPNLLFFDNHRIVRTINYQVQRMFSVNAGDAWLPSVMADAAVRPSELALSAVRDGASGDLIVKVVNTTATARSLRLTFTGFTPAAATAATTVLAGADPMLENTDRTPQPLEPVAGSIPAGPGMGCEAPPYSLTVVRIPGRR